MRCSIPNILQRIECSLEVRIKEFDCDVVSEQIDASGTGKPSTKPMVLNQPTSSNEI